MTQKIALTPQTWQQPQQRHACQPPHPLLSLVGRSHGQDTRQGDWHHPATSPFAPTKLVEDNPEEEQDVEVLVAEPEIAEPPMYAVVMYNDDYTPMEFVVHMLQSEFRHNMDKAVEIMLSIHNKGRGIAGIFPKDIAETKAKKTNQAARKEGYPLLTQIEPHQA